MMRFRQFAIVITLTSFLSMNCGDDNPTSSNNNNPSSTTVNAANIASVWGVVFAQSFGVIGQALVPGVLTKPAGIEQLSGTIDGTISGTASVTGSLTTNTDQTTTLNVTVVMDNYNSGGAGDVDVATTGTVNMNTISGPAGVNGTMSASNLSVSGTHPINDLDFNIDILNNTPSGSISYDGTSWTLPTVTGKVN